MEKKEFRVVILNEKDIRATLPSGTTREGTIKIDPLEKKTINFFVSLLSRNGFRNNEEMNVFGSYLYKILFPKDIGTEFKRAYDEVKAPNYLRLVLEFEQEAKELATLPWEFLYYPDSDREKGFRLAAESKLILSRHVPLSTVFSNLTPDEKPLRILIMISQPIGVDEIKFQDVFESIWNLKESASKAIDVDVKFHADKNSFHTKVNDYRPHVLHFIGHGKWDDESKTGMLAFENSKDRTADWVSASDFSGFFQEYQPRLIFLDACEKAASGSYEGFRGTALHLVYSKVPAVIAMQYPIANVAAGRFAKKFYECLGEGKQIDIAVQESRNELKDYLLDSKDELFSSRDFGSPVAFLQSAEGIVVARREEGTSEKKVNCPYPKCNAFVIPGAFRCTECDGILDKCPRCGNVMAKALGKCTHCPYTAEKSESSQTAMPKTEAAVQMPEARAGLEREKPETQGRQ